MGALPRRSRELFKCLMVQALGRWEDGWHCMHSARGPLIAAILPRQRGGRHSPGRRRPQAAGANPVEATKQQEAVIGGFCDREYDCVVSDQSTLVYLLYTEPDRRAGRAAPPAAAAELPRAAAAAMRPTGGWRAAGEGRSKVAGLPPRDHRRDRSRCAGGGRTRCLRSASR